MGVYLERHLKRDAQALSIWEVNIQLATWSALAYAVLAVHAAGGSGGGGGGGGGGGKVRVSAASLPSNLHSMSLAQLRAVCASHGLVAKGETTDDIIRQLEGATELGKVLMLEEKPPPKPRANKSVAAEPDSSDDDAKPDD